MIVGNYLAAIGLFFVVCGTCAQAWANLGEFKDLRRRVPEAVWQSVVEAYRTSRSSLLWGLVWGVYYLIWRITKVAFLASVRILPEKLDLIRSENPGDTQRALDLARFLRPATVWAIIAFGSVLALTAATIQLALAS